MRIKRSPDRCPCRRDVYPEITRVTAESFQQLHDHHRRTRALGRPYANDRWGFLAESRHFMESIQAGAQPLTNFAEAAKTMRLVDQIAADRR